MHEHKFKHSTNEKGDGFLTRIIKRLKISAAVILPLVLLGLGWVKITDPQSVPIKRVGFTGTYDHLSQDKLKNLTLPYLHQNFFAIDLQALKDSLMRLPWIENVTVSRHWPATIQIHFSERQAVAVWNNHSLLDSHGNLFSPPENEFPSNLPLLLGENERQSQVFKEFKLLSFRLKSLDLVLLEFNRQSSGAWTARLNNGVTLYFGMDNLQEKTKRFVQVYPQATASSQRQVDYVDLRYAHGLSFHWKTS